MICGDGVLQGTEQCDDGNTSAKVDGCSATCKLDPGWVCPLPGTACSAAKCGDGIARRQRGVRRREERRRRRLQRDVQAPDDDHHRRADEHEARHDDHRQLDVSDPGLSVRADEVRRRERREPADRRRHRTVRRRQRQAVRRLLARLSLGADLPERHVQVALRRRPPRDYDADGDGKQDEFCDDGNTRNGDGCDKDCKVELGYSCSATKAADPPYLDLPVVFRDFKYNVAGDTSTHPDFEHYGCANISHRAREYPLDPVTRVPVYAKGTGSGTCGTQLTSAADLTDWYQDIAIGGVTRGKRVDGKMLHLVQQASGAYVFDSATDDPFKSMAAPPTVATPGGFWPIDAGRYGIQNSDVHNFAFTTELRLLVHLRRRGAAAEARFQR